MAAVPWGPIIAGGSAGLGALLGTSATKDASKDAAKATKYGIDFQKEMFETTRSDFMPFLDAGTQALYELAGYTPSTTERSINPEWEEWTRKYGGKPAQPGVWGPGYVPGASAKDKFFGAQTPTEPNKFIEPKTVWNKTGAGVDITGGAGKFKDQLEGFGSNFEFDASNPLYQQKLSESSKAIDKILASRGLFNSRPGMNMLEESSRSITANEFENQYTRGRSNLMDLFNMSTKLGGLDYSKLLDLVKVGTGAAGASGSAAIQTGQGVASSYGDIGMTDLISGGAERDFWSGAGAMPLNYMLLNNMFAKSAPTAGAAASPAYVPGPWG